MQIRQLSFSLPIGATPNPTSDPELDTELYRIYNAINSLAVTLDVYSGSTPVPRQDASLVHPSQSSRLAQVNSGYAEAAVTLLAGDLVSFDSLGKMVKAQANATHNLRCRALLLEDTAVGLWGKYILSGVSAAFAGLTPGNDYFLGTTAGLPAGSAPAAGNTLQYIGFAISSTALYFNPELRYSVA